MRNWGISFRFWSKYTQIHKCENTYLNNVVLHNKILCFNEISRTFWKNVFVFQDCLWKDRRLVRGVTASGTTSDNKRQQVKTSGTTRDKVWKRMATNGNEWHKKWQQVTTNDNEWKQMQMSDREWQHMVYWMKTAQQTSKNGWLPSFLDKIR